MKNNKNLFLESNGIKTFEEEKILKKCGLSQNETKVFLTLLKTGSASVGKITQESGIHRRNVYDALERLAEKGLVGSVIKDNVKVFEVISPNRLLDLVIKEKERFYDLETEIRSVLPKLLTIRNINAGSQDVKIYRGFQSRRVIFEDILQTAKQNLVLGAHTPSKASMNYLKNWHKRRIKKGIKDKLIYCRKEPYSKEIANLPLTEVRFLPKKINTTTAINIYENKVAMLLWADDKPMSILIDNSRVAEDFRQYFNFLWKMSKKSVL